MSSAIVLIADGSEEIETLTPVDYLRRAGVETKLVSIKGEKSVVMAHGVKVEADCDASEIYNCLSKSELPDALVIPGGMPGSTNIAESEDVRDLVKQMNSEGKLVCAICAAPAIVLPATGALDGHDWTCYPGMEDNAAAYMHSFVESPVAHSGNLITARGPGAAEEFAMEIVRTLVGDDLAEDIKQASVQR